jgi:transcriptional regulator with PAS, ATPase and Fis domain
LPIEIYHGKSKRRLAVAWTLDVSCVGLFADFESSADIREDQIVRIHVGPPAETWPSNGHFFRGRVRRLENGVQLRCAIEVLDDPPPFLYAPELVGTHQHIIATKQQLLRVAEYEVNVLVRGESGTGKNVVARLVHQYSQRSSRPFVCVNCPSIPDTLLESQLFGHERGAFTDAKESRPGLFRVADRGTVVLDEISSVALSVQAKLLQAIEDKKFLPIGARDMANVDVRFVATTNADLGRMMRNGTFREDFFYRLNETVLMMPPLRDRASDVLLLADYFLRKYCREYGKDYRPLSRDMAERFVGHGWPGNVRELQNTVKRGVVLGDFEPTDPGEGPSAHGENEGNDRRGRNGEPRSAPMSMREARSGAEKQALLDALARCRYNRTKAAASLGISYRTLLRRMKKHEIVL